MFGTENQNIFSKRITYGNRDTKPHKSMLFILPISEPIELPFSSLWFEQSRLNRNEKPQKFFLLLTWEDAEKKNKKQKNRKLPSFWLANNNKIREEKTCLLHIYVNQSTAVISLNCNKIRKAEKKIINGLFVVFVLCST